MKDSITITLFFFGQYEHIVSWSENVNNVLEIVRPLQSMKAAGMSLLFFLSVPTTVVFFASSSSAKGIPVKKLSIVMLRPLPRNCSDKSFTNRSGLFFLFVFFF